LLRKNLPGGYFSYLARHTVRPVPTNTVYSWTVCVSSYTWPGEGKNYKKQTYWPGYEVRGTILRSIRRRGRRLMKNRHMVNEIKESGILVEIESNLRKIYGSKLMKIILYGSYARGEQVQGSDLDVMVLLNMDEEEFKKYSEQVLDLAVDLTTRYGIVVSIQENNIDFFNKWVDTLPFFNSVSNEGVELYGK
jgi:predicted nucleotidyltransferase